MNFDLIVATDENNGIGLHKNDQFKLPWHNKDDLLFFKNITSNDDELKAIIMGKNTFASLNYKPLPNRFNIVISSTLSFPETKFLKIFTNLGSALLLCKKLNLKPFVIGGSQLYKEALDNSNLNKIYWNTIHQTKNDSNIYFPINLNNLNDKFYILKTNKINNVTYNQLLNKLKNNDENEYLNLLEKIYFFGNERTTRNSITKSIFAEILQFDLTDNFPLITSKKMFLRGIFEELNWFLKGQTNSKILEDKNVNIWKGNSSKEFIENNNLPYQEGDIGNMYGFQLNHAGTEYIDCNTDYTNKGFNQIEYCLNLLKNDKFSRRIIMTTFIPHEAQKGVLYPCHGIVIQFYVREVNNTNLLSCHMYQRSADMFLGVPFNITSYSLLVYMICEVLNNDPKNSMKFKPDKLKISFGDLHIYKQHYDAVKLQLNNIPYHFPQIKFINNKTKLQDFVYEDIILENYFHHDKIQSEMIV
jgi:dihydrofolate reductase/thymidylate synthase